jgi:hypothetical protein
MTFLHPFSKLAKDDRRHFYTPPPEKGFKNNFSALTSLQAH